MKAIKKVLILGSGALKIGEAGEFDYSGSQAIKALKEEGIESVLINPNIATIQTSEFLASKVYFLPVTPSFVTKVIEKEMPDGIFLSFGGQTALNCGLELNRRGILKKYGVKVLGTQIDAIVLTEDRKKFANHLRALSISTPESKTAKKTEDAVEIARKLSFPVMVRSGFSLGGQGSGIARNERELREIADHAFSFVKQILVEKYLHHYKEVEYEIVRDKDDNCVAVCNMENMDPLGIHTGESIVIAPSQTLTNYEYHTLRSIAIKIVRSLKIVGECNVQFALNPRPQKNKYGEELEYFVIEVNARLSRSSALASKATGYPLAYVAAKLALDKNLTTLKNTVTKTTQFCFEPALDYLIVKIPRWDLHKFKYADNTIGSSMKSVGEVMGIGRTFEEAYQKAIRMLDLDFEGAINEKLFSKTKEELRQQLRKPTPHRMFALSQGFILGMSVEEVHSLTGIDPWFLYRIHHIVTLEKNLKEAQKSGENALKKNVLTELKQNGFSDKRIGTLTSQTGLSIRTLRKKLGVTPSIFQIDTLAGEFPAETSYLYLTYNGSHNDIQPLGDNGVIVLGSGPYRIGSSVEFDWTSVNTVLSLKNHKKKSIVINCNPETVSTDYDISDRLYFEELTFERIADIYDFEKPYGAIISVGGQTPNNRARSLKAYGCNILGTDPDNIDRAEHRGKFSALLDTLHIEQPTWDNITTIKKAEAFSEKVGYPVLIRPSYVLSGSSMKICHNREELLVFLKQVSTISSEYPVTISKFIEGAKEIEVDCVASQGQLKIIVVSEHVEQAGVHSGDATVVLPPQKLYLETLHRIKHIATNIAEALAITGPFNIQCLADDNNIKIIEVNLRSSRTFPFISKVTGINLTKFATDAFFGVDIPEIDANHLHLDFVAVKVAQFSFSRLAKADPILGVEMTSTGEVACFGEDIEEAFLKAELSVGGKIPRVGIFISLGGKKNKMDFLSNKEFLLSLNLPLFATEKTSRFLRDHGIPNKKLYKIHEKQKPNILDYFHTGKIDLAINITDQDIKKDINDDYAIRRFAVDSNIPLFTNLQKAFLFLRSIATKDIATLPIKPWHEYRQDLVK